MPMADGPGRLLAAPEHDDVSYGLAEHVAAESMGRFRGYWWAPDGQQLLAARVDISPVRRWWITDPVDPERPPRAVRYPAAGTANADVTLHVLRFDGSRTEVAWDRGAFEYLAAAAWDSQGPLLSVQSRDQRTVLVLAADSVTGQTTVLHAPDVGGAAGGRAPAPGPAAVRRHPHAERRPQPVAVARVRVPRRVTRRRSSSRGITGLASPARGQHRPGNFGGNLSARRSPLPGDDSSRKASR